MNFFEHQEQARKKTGLLVVLLVLAVISLVLVTVFALGVFFYFFQTHATSISAAEAYGRPLIQHLIIFSHSPIALWTSTAVVSVVVAATVFKYAQLRGGGQRVAEALGGQPLLYDNATTHERKVLNVVEEMAIASGSPVPPVYLLEERGINAFAAGLSRRDAVIGVTRGCVELLTRDELQGVIAHEFSHIHNGDMRLNMRLTALLHGILVIGLIGYFILRGSSLGYRGAYVSSSRNKGRGAQVSLGLLLVAIGYSGTFFGNLIKAAVSRQREYLADASAVQFTRDNNGIGNALRKIGGLSAGSLLTSRSASQFSHMYFSQGIKTGFTALLATHPELHKRIKRVLPRWNGSYLNPEDPDRAVQKQAETIPENVKSAAILSGAVSAEQLHQAAVNGMGKPDKTHVDYATALINSIPVALSNAARETFSARALIYCLLLDRDTATRKQQMGALHDAAHPATYAVMERLYRHVHTLDRAQFITLIDICIPALKQMSEPQYGVFKKNLLSLIAADKKTSIFEWCVFRIVSNNVEAREPEAKYHLRDIAAEISLIFSLIVHAGKSQSPGGAFQRGIESLDLKGVKFTLNTDNFSTSSIEAATEKMSQLRLLQKPRLLKAFAEIITADGTITPAENELYRALADIIDCPIPPLLHSPAC